jgi:hypothetical protein
LAIAIQLGLAATRPATKTSVAHNRGPHPHSFARGHAHAIRVALEDARARENATACQIELIDHVSHEFATFLGFQRLLQVHSFPLTQLISPDAATFDHFSSAPHRSRKVVPSPAEPRLHIPPFVDSGTFSAMSAWPISPSFTTSRPLIAFKLLGWAFLFCGIGRGISSQAGENRLTFPLRSICVVSGS